jgi:hypothetical protein
MWKLASPMLKAYGATAVVRDLNQVISCLGKSEKQSHQTYTVCKCPETNSQGLYVNGHLAIEESSQTRRIAGASTADGSLARMSEVSIDNDGISRSMFG